MIRRTLPLATAVFLLSSMVLAQADEPGPPRQLGSEALGEMLDFEVVSIDRERLMVTARDVESGDEFLFRLPPSSFRGQQFTADVGAERSGKSLEVRGRPDAVLGEVVLEEPLGLKRSAGGNARELRRPDYSPRPPGRSDFGKRPPRGPGDPGSGPGAGGPMEYQVESFDTVEWVVTARGSDGSKIEIQVDPEAFVGYRFRAPVRNMRRGQGFTMLALNREPIENCCTLLGDRGR